MAKNTNPITKKIYGQNSWSTITWNSPTEGGIELYQDIFIKRLVHGIFQKFKYHTSEVKIKKFSTGNIELSWLFIPFEEKSFKKRQFTPEKILYNKISEGSSSRNSKTILVLKLLIKSILILKYGNKVNYTFKILQAPNIFSNPKLVADYINRQLTQDPRQHRYVLNKLTWDFKGKGKVTARRGHRTIS